jgi:hypothetical protein
MKHKQIFFSRLYRSQTVRFLACLVTLLQPTPAAANVLSNALVTANSVITIVDTDTTNDISFVFGMRLYKTLEYTRTAEWFRFNDNLYVDGSVSTTQTISMSGSALDIVATSGTGVVSLLGLDGGKICMLDSDGLGYTVITGANGVVETRIATADECL